MSRNATDEDYVVEVVLDVGTTGVDLDALAQRLTLPGVALQHTTGRAGLWLTAVVAGRSQAAASAEVRESVLTQVADQPGATAAVTVTGVALGELYARLDPGMLDDDLDGIDIRDLVAARMWERDAGAA